MNKASKTSMVVENLIEAAVNDAADVLPSSSKMAREFLVDADIDVIVALSVELGAKNMARLMMLLAEAIDLEITSR